MRVPSILRRLSVAVVALLLTLPAVTSAQTALNSTTLSSALSASSQSVRLASLSNISAGHVIFVDREAMKVQVVNAADLTVQRGYAGTAAQAHASAALTYTGAEERFGSFAPAGACTRGAELYLPRVVLLTGAIYDCPVGTGTWTLINDPGIRTARSVWFNLDNGAGTTIDDVILRSTRPVRISACRIVYVDATTGTVAAGSAAVGVTVGGATIVAATNYTNSAAVGSTTAMVVLSGAVPANTGVFVRHTGVVAGPVGQSVVECDYQIQ